MPKRKLSLVQFTSQVPTGLVNYLVGCSEAGLNRFELNRLGHAANSRTEFRVILEDWVQALAEARFASWRREYIPRRREPVRAPTAHTELPKLPEPSTGNAGIMEPWFGTRKQASEIRAAQAMADRRKWSAYFYQFGCLVCKRTTVPHFSNGMCDACHERTCARLRAIVTELRQPFT